MSDTKNKSIDLYRRVKAWCEDNLPFRGKYKLMETIIDDLDLEKIQYSREHWDTSYDWNNGVAKILNQLREENIIGEAKNGRSYRYFLNTKASVDCDRCGDYLKRKDWKSHTVKIEGSKIKCEDCRCHSSYHTINNQTASDQIVEMAEREWRIQKQRRNRI